MGTEDAVVTASTLLVQMGLAVHPSRSKDRMMSYATLLTSVDLLTMQLSPTGICSTFN